MVEAMAIGQKLGVVTQVPFSETCRCVAPRLTSLRNRRFGFVDTDVALRPQGTGNADSSVVAARHHRRAEAEQTAEETTKSVNLRPSLAIRSRLGVA